MKRLSSLLSIAAVGLFVAGCGSEKNSDDVASSRMTKVEIALNWIPDAQHGGFFAAKVLGYFDEEGLDVTISPGGPNAPVIQKVATNRAQFGIGNADQILMARQQEADVVAVFAAMQNSPRCIMVHQESGIETLDQLRDVTLAVGAGKAFVKYMETNLPLEKVTMVPYTGSIIPFLNDKRFAQQAYVFSEPYVAKSRGTKTHCMMVSELGFNPYSSCLFVNGDVLDSNPELVRKVTRAVRRGWQSYLESPDKTNVEIQKQNPEMDPKSLAFGAEAIRSLCLPEENTDALGRMKAERWRRMAEQLTQLGFLDSIENYRDAFRLGF